MSRGKGGALRRVMLRRAMMRRMVAGGLAFGLWAAPPLAFGQETDLLSEDDIIILEGEDAQNLLLDDGTPPPRPAPRPVAQEIATARGAELRALDKVTGQTTDLAVRDGESVRFGRLNVTVTDCRYPSADQSSNAFAHVVIAEDGGSAPIFDAWMVATSPALSALDHPRYDVWVMRCMSS